MNLIPNDLMYDTLIDLTFDLVMAILLAPGINVHIFPFIKSSNRVEEKLNKKEINEPNSNEDLNENLSDCTSEVLNSEIKSDCSKMAKDSRSNSQDNLEKASRLFGQILENTKCYINQIFDDKNAEQTEEFIKQKEIELNKASDFLTDVVLNQDPAFPVDNNELNQSFKFIQDEFSKLNKLKESVKLNPRTSNSIESNLVPSYFENDSSSPNPSSDGEDDFEIIN